MDVIAAIHGRRSVRSYRPTPVPRELIEAIISDAAQAPPPELRQFCWSIQSLLPKVWLYLALAEVPAEEHRPFALHVEVAPKLKLHLSAFSCPLESNHAFRSGSEIASSSS